MKSYCRKSLEDLTGAELKAQFGNSPVFFIGSYISLLAPTNRLTGMNFTKSLYRYIMDEEPDSNFFLWNMYRKIPFEALMEMCPDKEEALSVLIQVYSTDEANDHHILLSKKLLEKTISAIITPNYDLTFDSQLSQSNCSIIKTDKDKWKEENSVYFKIHGSAEIRESIVYTLSQEGSLETWKHKLLDKIIKDKTVVFLGYSGRDFDICPHIAFHKAYGKIIWLHQKRDQLSAYAETLLESNSNNLLLYGDMTDLLNRLFPEEPLTKEWDIADKPIFKLKDSERIIWRINILNRLAYPRIGKKELNKNRLNIEEIFYWKRLGDFYGHEGSYRSAAISHIKAANFPRVSLPDRVSSLIDAAGYISTYGNYYLSWIYLRKAKQLFSEIKQPSKALDIKLLSAGFTFTMRNYQLASVLGRNWFSNCIRANAVKQYNKLYDLLTGTGYWDERQDITLMARRMRITEKEPPLALPSIMGYANLGLPSMDIIAVKDLVRYGDKEEQDKGKGRLFRSICNAEELGVYTEAWKQAKLKSLSYENIYSIQSLRYFSKWSENLHKPQYFWLLRIKYTVDIFIHYLKVQVLPMFRH